MKILIIDDNKDVTEMLSEYLQVKKIDCVVTNDGMNGLSLIKKEKFDSVFLDISMPYFTGIDVINALEKENLLKNQKIIIFTASSISNEQIQELLKKELDISWLDWSCRSFRTYLLFLWVKGF